MCSLHAKRTKVVFDKGLKQNPPIAFVGEGPGANEDADGVPFVGPAGQLLDRMIAAMGFTTNMVYVCNVVKCRPPGNREPTDVEAHTCVDTYLNAQLGAVGPRVIVALGRTAARWLGVPHWNEPGWRGKWTTWYGRSGAHYPATPLLATYHPAYLLRDPSKKRIVWEDLQSVMGRIPK